jgi:maleylacetoacetate isomerase
MRLYHSFLSSSSWRVRIVLALKRVDYESTPVDFASGEHQTPEYLAVNPARQVPTLEIQDDAVQTPGAAAPSTTRISQSVAICEYLEERFPEPILLPGGTAQRALAREIVEFVNAGVQPLHNGGLNRSLRNGFGASEDAILAWKQYWLRARLASLERLVAARAGTCAVGDVVTLADAFLYPQLERARGHQIDMTPFPTLCRVEDGLAQRREFVQTAGPERAHAGQVDKGSSGS